MACLFFEIGEFKLMLSDWPTVLRIHVQSRFHVFLMICKKALATCHSIVAASNCGCLISDNVIKALEDNQVIYYFERNMLDFLNM